MTSFPLPLDPSIRVGDLTDADVAAIAQAYRAYRRWKDKSPEQRADHARMMVKARVAGQSAKRRREIAVQAAQARWAK